MTSEQDLIATMTGLLAAMLESKTPELTTDVVLRMINRATEAGYSKEEAMKIAELAIGQMKASA